jgi:hypothetical protein
LTRCAGIPFEKYSCAMAITSVYPNHVFLALNFHSLHSFCRKIEIVTDTLYNLAGLVVPLIFCETGTAKIVSSRTIPYFAEN